MKLKPVNALSVCTVLLALVLASGVLGTRLIFGQGGTGRETTNTNSNKKTSPKRTTTPRKSGTSGANNNKARPDEAAADERTFWESVKNSTDPADFNSYLKRYPNGQYSDLARNSLRRLEAAGTNSNTTPANSPSGGETSAASSKLPRPCTPSPSGLVSWYSAENAAGDTVGSNNGSLINGATFAPGKVGQAFSFNGVNQYVQIPDSANLQSGAFTISVWVNFSSTKTGGVVLSKYDGNWHGWLLQAFDGGNFMFQIERTTNVQKAASGSLGPIAPNTWVHVAGTYDGTNVTLYLNGSAVGAVTFEGGYTPTATPMTIGKASWFDRDFVFGRIDEVEFFSRALSAVEIGMLAGIGPLGQCRVSQNSDPLTADPVLFPSDRREPAGEKVFTGKEVDQRAQISSKPKPMYTEEARKNLVSGTVILSAVLAANGQVTQVRVIKGLPNGLTEQAIAAARKVAFTPAIKGGHPVAQSIQFEYNFSPY